MRITAIISLASLILPVIVYRQTPAGRRRKLFWYLLPLLCFWVSRLRALISFDSAVPHDIADGLVSGVILFGALAVFGFILLALLSAQRS